MQCWYWGKIAKRHNKKLFQVSFDDDDVRDKCPDVEILDEFERDLDVEQSWLTSGIDLPTALTDREVSPMARLAQESTPTHTADDPFGISPSGDLLVDTDLDLETLLDLGSDTTRLSRRRGSEKIPYSLGQLYRERCCECTMCTRIDCGSCMTCNSSGNKEEVCIFKMCSGLDPDLKWQSLDHLPSFPVGWSYYSIDDHEVYTCDDDSCLCAYREYLDGTVFHFRVEGQDCRCWSTALSLNPGAILNKEKALTEFFELILGKEKKKISADHDLVSKLIYRQWIDVKNRRQEIYGKVLNCWSSDENCVFDIEYILNHRTIPDDLPLRIPAVDSGIPEYLVRGAHAEYIRKMNELDARPPLVDTTSNECCRWIVPDTRQIVSRGNGEIPYLVIHVQGFVLTFSAEKSGIPNAGLGLWVSCHEEVPRGRQFLELKAGNLLDLGVYAPLLPADIHTKDHITFIKNYIYNYECEGWSFDQKPTPGASALDITDDFTGKLHEKARANTIVYANETGGDPEVATISAEHDP